MVKGFLKIRRFCLPGFAVSRHAKPLCMLLYDSGHTVRQPPDGEPGIRVPEIHIGHVCQSSLYINSLSWPFIFQVPDDCDFKSSSCPVPP